jgi:RNA polymerase sigma factor (sigma-70 family)
MSRDSHSIEKDVEAQVLLGSLSQDDFNSFYKIWRHYQPYLFKLCLRQMKGVHEEAEDALSRTMLAAWERLPRHAHSIRDIKAWLTRLTLNLCIDIFRERRRHARVFESLDELPSQRQKLMASVETPEEFALRREFSCYLCSLIDELPPKLHDPFMLRFIHELSYIDISAQLSLSPENIRKRVQQARTILRDGVSKFHSGKIEMTKNNGHWKLNADKTIHPSVVKVAAAAQVEEIADKALTIRMVQVIGPSGIELSFPVRMNHRLSQRQHTRIETLSKYIRKHSGGWKHRLKMADLLYETGQWKEALEQYEIVLKKPRKVVEPYLRLGEIFHLMGRDDEAIETYRSAALAVHSEASHHHLTGLIEICRHRYDMAGCEFRRAALLEPHNVNHILELGRCRLLEESYVEALKAFDDSLKIKPDNIVALTYSYEALFNIGRLREAHQHIIQALELGKENVSALKWLADHRSGMGLVQGKEGQRTHELIKRVLRLSPESAQVHESLALYYLFRGEWVESIAVLRTYTEYHPACSDGWRSYASLLYRTGELKDAVHAIMKAYTLHQSDWRIQQTACEILAFAQKLDSLSIILEEMRERFPPYWRLWAAAGLALATTGYDPENACAIASRGTQLQPQIALTWFHHGRALALANRHLEAIVALKKGWNLLPEISEQAVAAMAWLGESKRHLGNDAEAQACWAEVLRHSHEFTGMNPARAYYWRGKALENLGAADSAMLAYRIALQLHLLYPERQEVLQKLQ